MVSSIDPKEESWNQLQRQLSNQRKSREVKRGGGGVNNNNNYNYNNSNNNNGKRVDFSGQNSGTFRNNNNNNNNNKFTNDTDTIKPAKYGTYISSPKNTQKNRSRIANNTNVTTPNTNINNNNNNNYTPINTPPRLRALNHGNEGGATNSYSATSQTLLPGISPYTSARQNNHNNYNEIPNLESWGITNQPRNEDLYSLYRYNPSPLINHNIMPTYNSNLLTKERKPYMIVPSLQRRMQFDSPPILFDSPSMQQPYSYIQSKPYSRGKPLQFSQLANRIERATDEYDYFKTNTAFSNLYIDEFISKTLQDQIIPDLLIETIANVKRDNRLLESSHRRSFNDPLKEEATQLLLKVNNNLEDQNDLFSTKFIDDHDYKAKFPVKVERTQPRRNHEADIISEYIQQLKNEVYMQPSPEPLIHVPVKTSPLIIRPTDITDLVIKDEGKRFAELSAMEMILKEDIIEPTVVKMCREIAQEVLYGYKKQVDLLQQREIKKSADEHLLETLTLDHLLSKLASHGRLVAENDDVNKLLDSMMIDILLYTHSDVRKTKNKTLNNYPLKKFHLNSFMNVALDALVGELSASLEDDMKELEMDEKKTLFPK